ALHGLELVDDDVHPRGGRLHGHRATQHPLVVADLLAERRVGEHRQDLLGRGVVRQLVHESLAHRCPPSHAVPTVCSTSSPALMLSAMRASSLPPMTGTLTLTSSSTTSVVPPPRASSRTLPVAVVGLPGAV